MDFKTFYGRKVIRHRFIQNAYVTIEQTEHGGSVVITGPHNNGEDSDIEMVDVTEMDESHNMPNGVAGELVRWMYLLLVKVLIRMKRK